MATIHQSKEINHKVEIGLAEGKEWSVSHLTEVKSFIKKEAQKRSPEQQLITQLYGIKYRMEEYLESNDINIKDIRSIEFFLADYLKVLNLSFKKFAISIDTTDGNLKKYLSGERKFNTDLAMKFGCFFHTSPDLWMSICTKNEFLLLQKGKAYVSKYKKYDYKNVVNLKNAS
ncbi:hypothetical protein SAMN05518672_104713 [Chitinophaga sp. CF118]|uniref:helix-turn-helix transcriptional regulator n=1 Tax=Chitinophaga sp. CF118 TaxID=1884367 RepID=UPI0008F32FA3|nr:hypothetical protein [Chitinophaga sp. CF118]SFE16163.1 hypothetical protein SAMN05518672_104713 [Chitinophaga sp. CF118]